MVDVGSAGCFDGSMTQGAVWLSHERFAFEIVPLQQLAAPPGRSLQPVPPHCPHAVAQHVPPA
jgi:hypothetical protein